jgi:hypothetical protein
MPIKTFRGLIADGGIDKITLHTNTGSTGYRIKKFELFPNAPGASSYEHVVKIYKTPQTSADGIVDFADQTLLGAAFIGGYTSVANSTLNEVVTFDHEIFNQDIYVTHSEVDGSLACNYYLELEEIKLDINQNTVATLRDIRNNASTAI